MDWIQALRIPLRIRENLKTSHEMEFRATVSQIDQFGRDSDSIWAEHIKKYRFGVNRTSDYLNWRYVKQPDAKYSSFKISLEKDELILVLKYYTRENGEKWAHICDLFQRGQNQQLIDSAIEYALQFAVKGNCRAISAWCFGGNCLTKSLDRNQFLLQKNLTRWLVISLNARNILKEDVSDEKKWHIAMGDSDVY